MGTKNTATSPSELSRESGVFYGIPQSNNPTQTAPSDDIHTMRMDMGKAIKERSSTPPSKEMLMKEMMRGYSLWAKISGRARAETERIIEAKERASLESAAKDFEKKDEVSKEDILIPESSAKEDRARTIVEEKRVKQEKESLRIATGKTHLEALGAALAKEHEGKADAEAKERVQKEAVALDPTIIAAKERARTIAETASGEIITAQLNALHEMSSKTNEIIDEKERALANVPKIVEEKERALAEEAKKIAMQKRIIAENSAKAALEIAEKEQREAEEARVHAEKEQREAEEAAEVAKREQRQAEEASQKEKTEELAIEERVRTAVAAAEEEVKMVREKARKDIADAIAAQEKALRE